MRINSISTRISKFIKNKNYSKEQKFLNNYCMISNDIKGDTFTLLNSARKTIANYAKSKGVRVEFLDAEKEISKEFFEFDIDERYAKKLAKNGVKVTVSPLKIPDKKCGGILSSSSEYVNKDTSKTYSHKSKKPILIDISADGIQRPALGHFEHDDSFLRHIYRVIENNVKAIENFYKK